MIYKSIVGSRSYGLSTGQSDVDVAIVSDKKQRFYTYGYDTHPYTPEIFVGRMTSSNLMWFDYQWIFPCEFCIENDLSKWISENREGVVKAMLPYVYCVHDAVSANFARNSTGGNKKIMYAIHFRNMLADYAEGKTFAEALKPQGAERTFLLSVRNGVAPKELVLEANAKARERAKAVAGFYAEPKADDSILDEFKHMVYREVEILKKRR